MPQPIIPKRKTREEIVAASKRLAPNINRPGDWIPNPKYRPKDPNSNEPRMILNPARKKRPTKTEDEPEDITETKGNGKKIREMLSSAVGSKAAGERAAAKIFDTDRASIARGKRAREKVFSRATPEAGTKAGSERARIAARRLYEAAGKNIDPRVATEPVKGKRLIDPTIDYEDTRAGLDEGFYKKGGKVSRKKSKKGKKASWNGNNEVSRWYD